MCLVGAEDVPRPGALSMRLTTYRHRWKQREHDGVVVFLQDVPGKLPDTANRVHEIRQVDLEFVPRTSVVIVGTTLSFPNDDRVFHNVFSTSKAGKFDLGLYKRGNTKTYTTKRVGEVEVFCNIHPHMAAKVLVVDTPFYGMSGREGHVWIGDIAPGQYRYVVWPGWGKTKSGRVTIEEARTTRMSLDVQVERPDRHARKDGSEYPEY
jgi:plastocyanin